MKRTKHMKNSREVMIETRSQITNLRWPPANLVRQFEHELCNRLEEAVATRLNILVTAVDLENFRSRLERTREGALIVWSLDGEILLEMSHPECVVEHGWDSFAWVKLMAKGELYE